MLADNLEGSGWEMEGRLKREGTYVYLWLIHVDVWQKPTQYCNYASIKNKLREKIRPPPTTLFKIVIHHRSPPPHNVLAPLIHA